MFVDQGGALAVVAKDVKLQVEFNHAQVNAYRLIGYENRVMRNEDFRDDAKDAGEHGCSGQHTCTAMYEIVPIGVEMPLPKAGKLKYQQATTDTPAAHTGRMANRAEMRYKNPDSEQGRELATVMPSNGLTKQPSEDFRFAASVAAFGMLLRDSDYKGNATYNAVLNWAKASQGEDRNGLRAEFVKLVSIARGMSK